MTNALTFEICNIFCDQKMACTKFQGNRFRIDGEIDKKYALHIYQKNCGPRFSIIFAFTVTMVTRELTALGKHWASMPRHWLNLYSAGIDFGRQNLTSVDVRF